MDKLISTAGGEVIITNDGATIFNKMEVLQPAAKMLVEVSKSQVSTLFKSQVSTKAVDVLTAMAVPVELTDMESLVKSASMNSKVVSHYSSMLAPHEVDSVLSVVVPAKPDLVDLRDFMIVKKLGVDDIELVKGLVFDKKVSLAAGGPTLA